MRYIEDVHFAADENLSLMQLAYCSMNRMWPGLPYGTRALQVSSMSAKPNSSYCLVVEKVWMKRMGLEIKGMCHYMLQLSVAPVALL